MSAVDHERTGAMSGFNPMFGDWQRHFEFAPVPYREGGAKRSAFRQQIQSGLRTNFFFTNELRLEIDLRLDVQRVLETSETADLDNYAKAILDGLKGANGILLDDSQVQTLTIAWTDTLGDEPANFHVSINAASPDDFMPKPVEFYEMSDRLWYPVSNSVWQDGSIVSATEIQHSMSLLIADAMSEAKSQGRHLLRQAGHNRASTYELSKYFTSVSARGFHKSRIDAAFAMHPRSSWRALLEARKMRNEEKLSEVEGLVQKVRDNYLSLAQQLATLQKGK